MYKNKNACISFQNWWKKHHLNTYAVNSLVWNTLLVLTEEILLKPSTISYIWVTASYSAFRSSSNQRAPPSCPTGSLWRSAGMRRGRTCSEKAWWTGLAGLLSHLLLCRAHLRLLRKKGRWAGAMSHRQTGRNTALPSPCRALTSATNDATRNGVGNVLPAPESQRKKEKKVKSLSHVRLFATPWTVAYQAPPSMGFSRQ